MKKYFLFLFLFLCLVTLVSACSPTGPCPGGGYWCICSYPAGVGYTAGGDAVKIKSIENISLYQGDVDKVYLNYYFIGYDYIDLTLDQDDDIYHVGHAYANSTNITCTTDRTVCVYPLSINGINSFYLELRPTAFNSIHEIDLVVANSSNGHDPTNQAFTKFWITSYDSINTNPTTNPNSNYNYSNTASNDGFIGTFANSILHIFPDSRRISTSVRLAYVFGSILLFFLLYYGIIFFIIKGNVAKLSSFFHYIFFIMCVLAFFFFIAIGYIPLGVLVILVLIIVVLAYFRFKSGFSAGGR